MTRLYEDFIDGTLSAGIDNSATTVSSAVFANLPVVGGGDELRLVLDPEAQENGPEVVKVTGHTASSTDVTVVRGQDGTSAVAHSSGAEVVCSLVASDLETLQVHTHVAANVTDFDTQVRTNRLSQMAAPNTDVSFASQKITNLGAPTSGLDAATKTYVDTLVGVKSRLATPHALTTGSYTSILFDTDTYDTGNFHNTSTNKDRFVVGTGYWHADLIVHFDESSVGVRALAVYVYNSSDTLVETIEGPLLDAVGTAGFGTRLSFSHDFQVGASGYLKFGAYQNRGSDLNCANAYVSIHKIGA